jgi:hypothetical protein
VRHAHGASSRVGILFERLVPADGVIRACENIMRHLQPVRSGPRRVSSSEGDSTVLVHLSPHLRAGLASAAATAAVKFWLSASVQFYVFEQAQLSKAPCDVGMAITHLCHPPLLGGRDALPTAGETLRPRSGQAAGATFSGPLRRCLCGSACLRIQFYRRLNRRDRRRQRVLGRER